MINYITESAGTIVDFLSFMMGEGFSTGREDTFKKYYNIIPYTF